MNAVKRALVPFQNIKFNILIFGLLAIASILGTLIPQRPENPDRVIAFLQQRPLWGAVLDKAQFFNIYYSWWFIGLLALMAFDVIVCKLIFGKFPGWEIFKRGERTPEAAGRQPFKKEWEASQPAQVVYDRVVQVLRGQRYSVETVPHGEELLVLASRHRSQRFGSWVSHVSILLILLATLLGSLFGFREILNVPEGQAAKMEHRPWTVACDRFLVEWYPGSSTPRTFASDIRLFDQGRKLRDTRILVNEPLDQHGVRFYQASYGPYLKEAHVGFFLRGRPKDSPSLRLRLNEESPIPGTPYTAQILDFSPDFTVDERGAPGTRSPHPNNPAIQVLISKNGKPVKHPWILAQFPGSQMPPAGSQDEIIPVLAHYIPGYYTGIQIAFDPGAKLFWIGCAILVAGLMTLFYLHHRKVWIVIRKRGGKTLVLAGAASSRGRSFEGEFLVLADALRSSTQPEPKARSAAAS